MTRRSKKHPFLIGVVLTVIAVAVIGAFLFRKASEPYRTVQVIPMSDYTANALSLTGNRYKIKGEVDNLLQWDATAGRLVALKTKQGPLAVIFPVVFSSTNIEKGQRLVLVGEVLANGLVQITEFQKQ